MTASSWKVLVTGGAGFIGSHLAARCLSRGHRVWVVDNLSTGRLENIPREAKFLRLDLSAEEHVQKLPREKFDVVFHLAAQSSGEVSNEDPLFDLKTNLLGTVHLLKWASTRAKRFIYASSMAVYGHPLKVPVSEAAIPVPLSYYGVNKLASEQYVQKFNRSDFKTTIFRMFSVYGPGQNLKNMKQGMISIYMSYVLAGKPVLIKGSKDRFRDFIYIDDVVEAWMRSVSRPSAYGSLYNLGTGKKTFVWQAVKKILEALGRDPRCYPIVYGKSTPADQFGLVSDITTIQRDLGWSPQVNLTDGFKKMAEWALGLRKKIKIV